MRTRLGILLGTMAIALGACGDDDEEALSKADFVAQADAICKEADTKTDALPEPKSATDVGKLVDQGKPIVQEQLNKLKELEARAPDEVAADYERALGLLDQQLPILDELKAAGADTTKLQAVSTKADGISKESDELAKTIGLKECGS